MRIDGIEIYRVAMPLIKPWITAYVEHIRLPITRLSGEAVSKSQHALAAWLPHCMVLHSESRYALHCLSTT
jgi:hypothetical protein